MLNIRKSWKSRIAAVLAAIMVAGTVAPGIAAAQDRGGRHDRSDRNDRRGGWDRDRGGRDWDRGRRDYRPNWRGERHWGGPPRHVHIRPRPGYYRPYYVPRYRHFDRYVVHRRYGPVYPGFGFYYRDHDAARFLGLTALSLIVFNQLNESQQRAHEQAMIEATNAPLGDQIVWNDSGRRGSVTPIREGATDDGRPCREFQQNVTIGGRDTEAYGTACQQPDGSWEVVNAG